MGKQTPCGRVVLCENYLLFICKRPKCAKRIHISDLIFFQSIKHRKVVHFLFNGVQFKLKIACSLKALEELLEDKFIRIHSQFLVNPDYILEYSSDDMFLKGQEKRLSIAPDRFDEVDKKLKGLGFRVEEIQGK